MTLSERGAASPWRVIHLHRAAPAKPAPGAPCNGCGVCCASAPCPLGMLISRRLRGACGALQWDDDQARYACGAVSNPDRLLPRALGAFAPAFARLARRWISAGSGCDASLEAAPADARAARR